MPSVLKSRAGRPSYSEMREQLSKLRKPTAQRMEQVHKKYYDICKLHDPMLKEIEVNERDVNWKALVMSLPPPQNSTVLGCGIRKILLKETECVYEGMYRFHVDRLDGSQSTFEWRDAYDDPYHNFKDKSFKDHVETALRAAVLNQLIEYKEMLSKDSQTELCSHISGVALPWERAVVQHFPTNLEMLVDAFLNENQTRMEEAHVCVQFRVCLLEDPIFLEKWQVFHRSQANYRIISTDEAMEQEHL